jgi:hypothetical protein
MDARRNPGFYLSLSALPGIRNLLIWLFGVKRLLLSLRCLFD